MKELKLDATIENIVVASDFVQDQLAAEHVPEKACIQVSIAVDEIFGNIARYAYDPGVGSVTVRVEFPRGNRNVLITFIDQGVPYNPLAKEDPDITLCAEERESGGLGIYLVKKSMDDVSYEYKDGYNILRVGKNM